MFLPFKQLLPCFWTSPVPTLLRMLTSYPISVSIVSYHQPSCCKCCILQLPRLQDHIPLRGHGVYTLSVGNDRWEPKTLRTSAVRSLYWGVTSFFLFGTFDHKSHCYCFAQIPSLNGQFFFKTNWLQNKGYVVIERLCVIQQFNKMAIRLCNSMH